MRDDRLPRDAEPADPLVGAPYRRAPRAPGARSARWRGVASCLAAAALALGAAALCARAGIARRPSLQRVADGDRLAPGSPIEHATSLASGSPDQVYVVTRTEAGSTEVLVFPGALRTRGGDEVAIPRAIPMPDARRVVSDGYVVDARGRFRGLFPHVGEASLELPADGIHGHAVEVVPEDRRGGSKLVARMDDGVVRYLTDDHRWVDITDPPTRARRISGRGEFLCGLLVDGSARCWLRSYLGDPPSYVGSDVPALALPEAEAIVVGLGSHVCSLSRSGRVACAWINWPGTTNDLHLLSGPLALGEDHGPVRSMALGERDLCVIERDGTVRCVRGPERDAIEDLGDRTSVLHRSPLLDGAVEIALATTFGCARWPSGAVRCWGAFMRGGAVRRRDAPVVISDIEHAERLIDGEGHWCALQRGELVCRGLTRRIPPRNQHEDDGRPWRVTMHEPITSAVFVDARDGHSEGVVEMCATLRSGAVACDGSGPVGPAGRARLHALTAVGVELCAFDESTRMWCTIDHAGFARAPAFDGFHGISALGNDTCAWRDGAPLQCALSASERRSSTLAGTRDVVGVLGGSCALRSDGTRLCVGGEAVVTRERLSAPLLASLGGAVRMGAGDVHGACFVGVNGRVACSRSGARGEPPTLVAGIDDVEEVISPNPTCARRRDGRVLCWGDNVANTLTWGDAEHSARLVPLRR